MIDKGAVLEAAPAQYTKGGEVITPTSSGPSVITTSEATPAGFIRATFGSFIDAIRAARERFLAGTLAESGAETGAFLQSRLVASNVISSPNKSETTSLIKLSDLSSFSVAPRPDIADAAERIFGGIARFASGFIGGLTGLPIFGQIGSLVTSYSSGTATPAVGGSGGDASSILRQFTDQLSALFSQRQEPQGGTLGGAPSFPLPLILLLVVLGLVAFS